MGLIQISFNGTATDLDDFVTQYDYQATIKNAEGQDIPNPETKPQFFQRKVKEFVWETVKTQRATRAADTARKTETDKVVNF